MVLLYPAKYHDIHTVVNLSGRYDLNKGIEERMGKDFMQKIKEDILQFVFSNLYIQLPCPPAV